MTLEDPRGRDDPITTPLWPEVSEGNSMLLYAPSRVTKHVYDNGNDPPELLAL